MRATILAGLATMVMFMSGVSMAGAHDAGSLHGYWEVQKVLVDGNEDGGEVGAYWIFRDDGTFKIVKRGRKPEGSWSVSEDRLLLEVSGIRMLDGVWRIEGERLVIEATQASKKLVFLFMKRALASEPKEPRSI